MSTFTDLAELDEIAVLHSPEAKPQPARAEIASSAAQVDRRAANRFRTAFRPGCLIIGNRVVLGLIRNMSSQGVMIEVAETLREGQRVSYFWDERRLVSARVVWSEGNRHGLENDAEHPVFDKDFTYRSVRIPCRLDAEVWVNGDKQKLEVTNLSLGGMRLRRLGAQPGARLTIAMAGIELYNADVRWNDGEEAGIRFAERLTRDQLAAVLSHESVQFDQILID